MKSNFPNLAHAWAARRLDPDKMDALNNTRYKPSRRSNRRTSRRSNAPLSAEDSALANNSKPSVEAASYKSVLSSRPLTAAGSDVPVEYRGADDRGTDSYPSLMFSEQAWNPPDAFLALAPRSKSLGDPLSVPLLDADDEEFFSTLFDEVLNDAEQFTAGMGTVEVDLEVQSPFVPSLAETLEPFEISNVLYIASPEIRDLVSRYPTRMKQELDENDVVQMTNATMTQVRVMFRHAPCACRIMIEVYEHGFSISSRETSAFQFPSLDIAENGLTTMTLPTPPTVDDHQRGYREDQHDDDANASIV